MYRPHIVEPTTPYRSLQSQLLVIYKAHILSLCLILVPTGLMLDVKDPILVICRPHISPSKPHKGPFKPHFSLFRPYIVHVQGLNLSLQAQYW